MSTNRSMPPATIIPELPYADVRTAVDWLCQAFGFKERLQIGTHRAQLQFGSGSLVVVQGTETSPSFSVMVRVEDVNSHFETAVRNGAQTLSSPTNYPYGERQYTALDIGGHHWTFSQTIADIDPATWGGQYFD